MQHEYQEWKYRKSTIAANVLSAIWQKLLSAILPSQYVSILFDRFFSRYLSDQQRVFKDIYHRKMNINGLCCTYLYFGSLERIRTDLIRLCDLLCLYPSRFRRNVAYGSRCIYSRQLICRLSMLPFHPINRVKTRLQEN